MATTAVPGSATPTAVAKGASGAAPVAATPPILRSSVLSPTAPPADIVGNYRLGKTLGQGTYGKVKVGTDLRTGEKFAVKIMEKASIQSEKEISRLQREIRFLKLLHHPHIVKVFDVIETEGQIYIAMEQANGGELFDYIVAHKRVKEKEARIFFRQIISAVDYCHQNAVIHRDLKPENLLLDSEKNIKIIDFGFGNTFKTDGLLDTFCGSPFYAAPEMILGKRYEGPEVDIWSMGVILFALVCGHLPFDDENVKDLYRKISTASYQMPSHVPGPCKELIQRMICADSKKRATLEEIKNHPWVCEGFDGAPSNMLPTRPIMTASQLNPDIVRRLFAFGYKEDDVRQAFDLHAKEAREYMTDPVGKRPPKIHHCIPTYHLLVEMLQREVLRQQQQLEKLEREKKEEEQRKRAAAAAATEQLNTLSGKPNASALPALPTQPDRGIPLGISRKQQLQLQTEPSAHSLLSESGKDLCAISEDAEMSTESLSAVHPALAAKNAKENAAFTSMPIGLNEKSPKKEKAAMKPGQILTNQLQVDDRQKSASANQVASRRGRTATLGNHDRSHTSPSPRAMPVLDPKTAEPVAWNDQPPVANSHARRESAPAPPVGFFRRLSLTIGGGSGATPVPPQSPNVSSPRSKRSHRRISSNASASPMEVRSITSWFMNVATTSNKTPQELMIEVKRVLALFQKTGGVRFDVDPMSPWIATCEVVTSVFLERSKEMAEKMGHQVSQMSLGTTSSSALPSPSPAVKPTVRKTSPLREVNTAEPELEDDEQEEDIVDAEEEQPEDASATSDEEDEEDGMVEPTSPTTAGASSLSQKGVVAFQIEVCKVPRLNLHGLHFKRMSGGVWSYKKVCNRLLPLFNL